MSKVICTRERVNKSIFSSADTGKSDRSTPTALLQTLLMGSGVPVGPTVKSLDDTTDSSFRVSDREELMTRIKEVNTFHFLVIDSLILAL